jgi:hypothetical protein
VPDISFIVVVNLVVWSAKVIYGERRDNYLVVW